MILSKLVQIQAPILTIQQLQLLLSVNKHACLGQSETASTVSMNLRVNGVVVYPVMDWWPVHVVLGQAPGDPQQHHYDAK